MIDRSDGVIDLDLLITWPDDLRRLLDDNLDLLRAYELERARIDQLREDNFLVEYYRSQNDHAPGREAVVRQCDLILSDKKLLGFHCTRLTADEASDILANGMETLSPDLLERRIRRRVEVGDLTIEAADTLLSGHRGGDENREGMAWFSYARRTLREDQGGLYRLFRSWGGEALYWGHEEHPEIGPLLTTIGRPCIVVAAMPIADIQCYGNMGERFVRSYLSRYKVETGQDSRFGGNTRQVIGAEDIRDIIVHGTEQFENLTGASRWRKQIA